MDRPAVASIEVSHATKKRVQVLADIANLTPERLVDKALAEYINRHQSEIEVGMRVVYSLLGITPGQLTPLREDDLQSLEISTRTYNALLRAGVRTIDDVAGATEDELYGLPTIGAKSIKEIKEALFDLDLRLSTEDSRETRPKWLDDRDELLRQRGELG